MIRAILIVLVGAAVLTVVGLVVGARHQGRDFEGGSFSTWVKRAGPDARVEEAVVLEGPALIPELVDLVNWEPSPSEQGGRRVYNWIPESWQSDFRLLNVADPEDLRPRILRILGEFGPEASSALNSVLAWTSAPGEVGQVALAAALRIAPDSPEVIARILAALGSDDPQAQRRAARAIWDTGIPVEGGIASLRLLVGGTQPPAPEVIGAIGVYGPQATQTLPRLVPWLQVPELKRLVLQTLRQFGPASAMAVTEVRSELKPDSPALGDALEVVVVMGRAGSAAVPEVQALEHHPASMVRVLAASALAELTGNVTNAVKSLSQELQLHVPDPTLTYHADSPLIRDIGLSPAGAAAWQLGRLGRKARSAEPDLIAAISSDDLRVATLAAWALWRVTGESELVVPALRRGLAFSVDPSTQLIALGGISELGPMAPLLVNDLREMTALRLDVRRAAREQLGIIQLQATSAGQ